MTKKWILAVITAGCMVFASCKKDDHPSTEEVYHTELSDRIKSDLFGNIKVSTKIFYYQVFIKDGGNIVPGDPSHKHVTNYNPDGWITKIENSSYDSKTESYVLQSIEEKTYDGQNRVTLKIYSEYDDKGNTRYGDKYEYMYDDNNKTATVINSVSTDGTTYEQRGKLVYTLNKYNRIDENSSRLYYPVVTKVFATEAAGKWIVEKDDQGNPILSYFAQCSTDGKLVSVGEYTKISYEYY